MADSVTKASSSPPSPALEGGSLARVARHGHQGGSAMSKFRALLLVTTLIPLAACGPTDVASPGEGTIVTPPAPTPRRRPRRRPPAAGSRPRPARPAPSTAASSAPAGAPASCRAASPPTPRSRTFRASLIRSSGPVNVGTDCGGDPAAPLPACQAATLTIQAGTLLFASAGNDYLVVNRGSRLNAIGTAGSADHLHRARQHVAAPPPMPARACGAASSCSAARRSATATPRSPAARSTASR